MFTGIIRFEKMLRNLQLTQSIAMVNTYRYLFTSRRLYIISRQNNKSDGHRFKSDYILIRMCVRYMSYWYED